MNLFFIATGLFLMLCAYSVQYWAKRCFLEIREIKSHLEVIRTRGGL